MKLTLILKWQKKEYVEIFYSFEKVTSGCNKKNKMSESDYKSFWLLFIDGPRVQLHLHFSCKIVAYLLPGRPCCSHGIHGNSVAYSKSVCSNYVDSLQQMSDVPSSQLTPRERSTTVTTEPCLEPKTLSKIFQEKILTLKKNLLKKTARVSH